MLSTILQDILKFLPSHSMFCFLALYLGSIISSIFMVIMEKGKESSNTYFVIGEIIKSTLATSLLFSHLSQFLKFNTMNSSYVFYIIIALTISAFSMGNRNSLLKPEAFRAGIGSADYHFWLYNNFKKRYLINSIVFALLIFFPVIYQNIIINFLPSLYLNLENSFPILGYITHPIAIVVIFYYINNISNVLIFFLGKNELENQD